MSKKTKQMLTSNPNFIYRAKKGWVTYISYNEYLIDVLSEVFDSLFPPNSDDTDLAGPIVEQRVSYFDIPQVAAAIQIFTGGNAEFRCDSGEAWYVRSPGYRAMMDAWLREIDADLDELDQKVLIRESKPTRRRLS